MLSPMDGPAGFPGFAPMMPFGFPDIGGMMSQMQQVMVSFYFFRLTTLQGTYVSVTIESRDEGWQWWMQIELVSTQN
jgi:hypothetical protein